jgi:SdrD B-like domain
LKDRVRLSKIACPFSAVARDGRPITPERDPGEPGLEGWRINLYQDTGTKGSYDGEAEFQHAITGPDRSYTFDRLFAGDYIVCEELQADWQQSAPTSAPSGETLVTNCPGNTRGYAFTMGGADRAGNDFGNFQQGTVSGTKFKDRNDNGARDAGEFGLSGWKIHVYDSTGTEVTGSPLTTDSDGNYSINLNPGTYTVCEEITDHTGWVQSYPTASTADSASCAALGGGSLAARGGRPPSRRNEDVRPIDAERGLHNGVAAGTAGVEGEEREQFSGLLRSPVAISSLLTWMRSGALSCRHPQPLEAAGDNPDRLTSRATVANRCGAASIRRSRCFSRVCNRASSVRRILVDRGVDRECRMPGQDFGGRWCVRGDRLRAARLSA